MIATIACALTVAIAADAKDMQVARVGAPRPKPPSVQVAMLQQVFDTSRLDVAGLRVGGRAKNFETTAARLFGTVTRVTRAPGWHAGYASALQVNPMECFAMPGRKRAGEAGNVCVTAFLDANDIVRAVRIERVFPFVDAETFRATLVRRYGEVDAERDGARWSLGWGPQLNAALVGDSGGPRNALTAHYTEEDGQLARSHNEPPKIHITLQLVDAAWATAPRTHTP